MKLISIPVSVFLVTSSWLGSLSGRAAGIVEQFSYANGNLTTVSGGAWVLWTTGAGDATVVSGAARIENTTDVIRSFPAVLATVGETATISFTLNIALANSSEAYEFAFVPASSPFGPANTNYANSVGLRFDGLTGTAGMSTIQAIEGTGTAFNMFTVGSMTAATTHIIRLELTRAAASVAYSLFVDDTQLRTSSFVLTDARGINAIEFLQSGTGTTNASALLDNLVIIPEPSSGLLTAIGALGALGCRKRRTPDMQRQRIYSCRVRRTKARTRVSTGAGQCGGSN